MQREGERLVYLQALGITQYVPLHPIPGTLELPLPEWNEMVAPEPDAVAAIPEAEEVSVATYEQPAAHEIVSQHEDIPSPVVPTQTADIPQLDLSKVKIDETPRRTVSTKVASLQRFALAVVTLPQRGRILLQLAQPDAPGLSALEFRMASDLLLALNIQQEINDSSTKLFRWPLVNNPRIAADASAARDGLLAFLAATQAEQPVTKFLFLGTVALQCFAHQQIGEAFALSELNTQTSSTQCLITHSLSAQHNDWALKPVVWRHLQSFL